MKIIHLLAPHKEKKYKTDWLVCKNSSTFQKHQCNIKVSLKLLAFCY